MCDIFVVTSCSFLFFFIFFAPSLKSSATMNSGQPKDKNAFISTVQQDVVFDVLAYVGFLQSTRAFSRINKVCLKRHRESFSTTKSSTEFRPKLIEKEGRLMCEILECLRFAVVDLDMAMISPAARNIIKSFSDLHTLRQRGMYDDLMKLNVSVYSYWDRCASPMGVFEWLKKSLEVNPHLKWGMPIERDVKYWKDSRVFGDFFVLFDRQDGTIMTSTDCKKVYLVQGLAQSIGEALPIPRKPKLKSIDNFHEVFLGRKIATTLLNWDGKVVYDGLMMHLEVMNGDQRNKAIKAYCRAVDNGALICSLEKKLVKVEVPFSSSGNKIKLQPSHTIPVEHQDKAKRIVDRLTAAPPMKGDPTSSMAVFRRHGYTEKENPEHFVSVMMGGGVLVPFHAYKALVPSLMEILDLIDLMLTANGNKKPGCIAIDVEYAVEPLQKMLSGSGVHLMYYPPPSKEEEAYSNRTNPYLSPREKERNVHPGCGLCDAEFQADGNALLKCARCKMEHYCCREHQKTHWKVHKKFCFESNAAGAN